MTSRIFLDSSILVERAKRTQVDLFDHLVADFRYELCISQIVLSEFTFYLLVIEGGKAPLTLKREESIPALLQAHDPALFLSSLSFLETGPNVVPLYLQYMQQYNLLPNDALILAVCKLNGINQLASYDSDFRLACLGEGIQLIQSISDLTRD